MFALVLIQVQSEIRKAWTRFQLTHHGSFRPMSCLGRNTMGGNHANTSSSSVSRARESVGSQQHMHEVRCKVETRRLPVDETPLNSETDKAEKQPLTNGKTVCIKSSAAPPASLRPIISNGSSSNEDPRDCEKGLSSDGFRVE